MASKTVEESSAENKKQSQKSILQYPSNLGEHRITFKFYEYEYDKAALGKGKQEVQASIALPLPQNFVDSSRLEVGGSQIGITGALTADLMGQTVDGSIVQNVTDDAGQISQAAKSIADMTTGEMLDFAKSKLKDIGGAGVFLSRAVAGAVSNQIAQGISATAGNAINPQTTLIFDGVDLKIHNFEWLFSPKNLKESEDLDEINRLIQYYIHPEYNNPLGGKSANLDTFERTINRGLLTYPALVEVTLEGVAGGLKAIFKSGKFLMVNNFNIDYTPNGMVLNKGGRAAVIRCSMNTTETMIRTRADFEDGTKGVTGSDKETSGNENDSNDGSNVFTVSNTETQGSGQTDVVEENNADTGDTESKPDTTPAYRVKLPGGQGGVKYDLYNAAGKKVRSRVPLSQARNLPNKSTFQSNPPVDR